MSSQVAPVTFTCDRFQQGARQQEFSGGIKGRKKSTLGYYMQNLSTSNMLRE